jgi:hypothetical protein
MRFALINTSVADLDSTIRCAVSTGHPIPLSDLQQARDTEAKSAGARSSVIKLLDREIKRQTKELRHG